MAYTPTYADIPKDGYQPTYADIPEDVEASSLTPAQSLIQQSDAQGLKQTHMPQMQEQYSNPTQWPGFENLPKEEQKQRIALSTFDPANQTSFGTVVPPGAFEHPATRMVGSVLGSLGAPELRLGTPILKNILNAVSRAGTGTAANIAYESPNIKSLEDLKNVAKQGASLNAMMEVPVLAGQAARGAASVYRPSEHYVSQKMNEIKNEAAASRQIQRSMYEPIFKQYGDVSVASSGRNYLNDMGIKKKGLYPEAKIHYDNFIKSPTLKNLQDFQSQLFKDISKTDERAKPATVQRLIQHREKAQNGIREFLQRDPKALENYLNASRYTRNVVEPYEATNALRKITAGTKGSGTPKQLRNHLNTAAEKIQSGRGESAIPHIPVNHPLRRHLEDVNNAISKGELLQSMTPKLVKDLLPNVGGVIRNDFLNSLLKKSSPLYYGGLRAAGMSQNQI